MLQPHQLSAVGRLLSALDEFNGALLCDDVGMGKTYVALAVARKFKRLLVVTPAALEPMWHAALTTTASRADLVTFEALSRADLDRFRGTQATATPPPYDLVVVDEAHHARNPATNRYFALSSLVRGARVLLLSATPIHNRRTDLVALLSLFLGSRVRTMTAAELALCVVRREHSQLEGSLRIPAVAPIRHHELPDEADVVEALMNLPPPLPARDGGLGGVLIGRGLVHQWASSEAALYEAVKRRIARATALSASLEAGTYPTARELETWIYGDGSLQLGFPELLAAPIVGHQALLDGIRVHLNALVEFRARFAAQYSVDVKRARIVADIRNSDYGAKIVAFAQYSETVSMLFRRLAPSGRVAMLTSHGARVAGGAITRREAIAHFAPLASHTRQPGPAETIDLLLTTDLLSEGVNLQDAGVVIHLDVPWTFARMEQRVGRVARMGSTHSTVSVHVLRPPQSAANVLDSELIVRRKWSVANLEVGTSMPSPLSNVRSQTPEAPGNSSESEPAKTERLRSILREWISEEGASSASDTTSKNNHTVVATATAQTAGFLAVVSAGGPPQLLVCGADEISTELDTQITACLHAASPQSDPDEVTTDPARFGHAVREIQDWFLRERASATAGLGVSSSVRRKQLTSRIDSAVQTAAPHLRSARSIAAARARKVVTAQQCAAIERELDSLSHSARPIDEWLKAIAALNPDGALAEHEAGPGETLKIHGILLMREDTRVR